MQTLKRKLKGQRLLCCSALLGVISKLVKATQSIWKSALNNLHAALRLLEPLYLLACIIKLRLQLLYLRLGLGCSQIRVRFLRLKVVHLTFQKRNMISEGGCRTMLADPFFDVREWVHIFRGAMTPNVQSSGTAAERDVEKQSDKQIS
jgi:hypothetical protein